MAYVPVPKDLSRVKTKVLFYLTAPLGVSTAALVMVIVMLPFFLLAIPRRGFKCA